MPSIWKTVPARYFSFLLSPSDWTDPRKNFFQERSFSTFSGKYSLFSIFSLDIVFLWHHYEFWFSATPSFAVYTFFFVLLMLESQETALSGLNQLNSQFLIKATSKRIRIFLNLQNRTSPSTRIRQLSVHSSTQDSSRNIGERVCVEVAILNTVFTVKNWARSCYVTG